MKVKELIAVLEQYNGDLDVNLEGGSYSGEEAAYLEVGHWVDVRHERWHFEDESDRYFYTKEFEGRVIMSYPEW